MLRSLSDLCLYSIQYGNRSCEIYDALIDVRSWSVSFLKGFGRQGETFQLRPEQIWTIRTKERLFIMPLLMNPTRRQQQSAWSTTPSCSYPDRISLVPDSPRTHVSLETAVHSEENHLRSFRALRKLEVHGSRSEADHLEDLVIDDQTWFVQSMVLGGTENFRSPLAILSPQRLQSIDWETGHLIFDNLGPPRSGSASVGA